MVVPCKRSIFLLSSAMMLWSSVMRSSYRSVVRSWTSSCSLMRWDCSHWDQENKTEVPMSGHTYGGVTLNFMVSNHHNLNVGHAPNKHRHAHQSGIPEATTTVKFYNAPLPCRHGQSLCLCSIHSVFGGKSICHYSQSLWHYLSLLLFPHQEVGKWPELDPSDTFFWEYES